MRRFLIATSLSRFQTEPHTHAKILVAALLISNGVRQDVEVIYYLTDINKTVKIIGGRVKRLFPDEQSAIGFLKKALVAGGQTGVVARKGPPEREGIVMGPVSGPPCVPKPPYTYVIELEKVGFEIDCGMGLAALPPHHQVVVVNVTTDRLLSGRRTF